MTAHRAKRQQRERSPDCRFATNAAPGKGPRIDKRRRILGDVGGRLSWGWLCGAGSAMGLPKGRLNPTSEGHALPCDCCLLSYSRALPISVPERSADSGHEFFSG